MADPLPDDDEAMAKAAAVAAVAAAAAAAPPWHADDKKNLDMTVASSARKAFLLGLVPCLSLDEIWMLQARLARLDLRTDVVGRLPAELQIMVADQLGPADLGCCLEVSRRWRALLLHEALRKKLARRCFPALLEYADAVAAAAAAAAAGTAKTAVSGSDETKNPVGADDDADAVNSDYLIDRIFVETARKYAARALGRFRYVIRHVRDPPLSLTEGAAEGVPTTMYWLPPEQQRRQQQQQQQQPSLSTTPSTEPARQGEDQQEEQEPSRVPPPVNNDGLWTDDDNGDDNGDDDEDSEILYGTHEYAYGRIAWQCIRSNGTSFLVDDLRTGKRVHLAMPSSTLRGEAYLLSAFGDELLVASTGIRLLAWNFRTGEHHIKQMPMQVDVVATLGRRICILALGNIYHWTLGGPVQQVDMTGLDAKHRLPDRDGRLPSYFLLDPVQTDVFYLGTFELDTDGIGRSGDLCFYVHRFEALRYRETFTYRLPYANHAFPTDLIEATVRRNARGLYSLASWRVCAGAAVTSSSAAIGGALRAAGVGVVDAGSGSGGNNAGLPQTPVPLPLGWSAATRVIGAVGGGGITSATKIEGIGSLAFNMYTHTFTLSFFRLPPLAPPYGGRGAHHLHGIRMHIWNDQMLVLTDRHRETATGGLGGTVGKVRRATPLLFAFDDACSEAAARGPAQPFSAVPLYTSPGAAGLEGSPTWDQQQHHQQHQQPHTSRRPPLPSPAPPSPRRERRCRVRINELHPTNPGRWQQDDPDWATHRCLLRFALDVDAAPPEAQSYKPAHVGSYQLQGDDDFLVFHHGNQYTVWAFGPDETDDDGKEETRTIHSVGGG
ncbi:F-box domain, Skp2-like protein [Niveomyces insectorum RCEF 264]|uniref:F-box domain, Skp2-like protein n=1 Tax=Niveomyces insectorum RCEF 264 TaxID=1081102 RepID=A0A167QEN0_9HYPO|nr:F-box domain, Skp2-like protein [Niveomyces insectorum RCEF 264]